MSTDHPVRPWVVTDPCACTKPGRAPDLSPAEAARVAEFDAAPEPPEIRVERVISALIPFMPPLHPNLRREVAKDAAIAALDAS